MNEPDLAHWEMLAGIDEVTNRTARWVAAEPAWPAVQRCQNLLARVLSRVDTLRIRLEAPLVVATFGGTGVGKSTLVNALVGAEVTRSGRERPTTTKPILIAHPRTQLEEIGLDLSTVDVVRREADLLQDVIVIDCPDPDTSESATTGSNLEQLRGLLPHCDVLIYVSTQQKYRSSRVAEELGQAAAGCRIVFVQTRADLDDDIREDWREQLREHYEVPDVFFVDSMKAQAEQQQGQHPTGDMGRLIDLLKTQLAASERSHIRRANVIDMLQLALRRCREWLKEDWPPIEQLSTALTEQKDSLSLKMSQRLQKELLVSRHLWERRLLTSVTENWGFSPFSSVLRFYNGIGGFLASFTLFRARNTAQVALIGALEGARWLKSKKHERTAEESLVRASSFGLDDALLQESQLVIDGYARSAGLDVAMEADQRLDTLRTEAARVGDEFLDDAGHRVDDIIGDLAERNSGWLVRCWYELLFLLYVGFVLYRIGRNFFYDSLILELPLLATDFYIPAVVFFVLWSGLLVMLFTRRLRRGLNQRIRGLSEELVAHRLAHGLFPRLETACRTARIQRDELTALEESCRQLRNRIAHDDSLGSAHISTPAQPGVLQ